MKTLKILIVIALFFIAIFYYLRNGNDPIQIHIKEVKYNSENFSCYASITIVNTSKYEIILNTRTKSVFEPSKGRNVEKVIPIMGVIFDSDINKSLADRVDTSDSGPLTISGKEYVLKSNESLNVDFNFISGPDELKSLCQIGVYFKFINSEKSDYNVSYSSKFKINNS